jgi:hypothetical protein
VYRIDWNRLMLWWLPNKLKRPLLHNFIISLILPLQQIHVALNKYREKTNYRLLITPQVCHLQRMLNDRFDFTDRRIYIVDMADASPVYIFRANELKPKWIFYGFENRTPLWLYTNQETQTITDDFVVMVPVSVIFDVNEMSALLNVYKLAGTKFKIQTFL